MEPTHETQLIPTWIQHPELMGRVCVVKVELQLPATELHLLGELAIKL